MAKNGQDDRQRRRRAARAALSLLQARYRRELPANPEDWLTAGTILRTSLGTAFPEDSIYLHQEERSSPHLGSYWLIDFQPHPGHSFFGPVLTWWEEHELQVAAVQALGVGRTISAGRELGAAIDDEKLSITSSLPQEAMRLAPQSPEPPLSVQIARLRGWPRLPAPAPFLASACYLATGRINAFQTFETGSLITRSAGLLLLQEAGAVVVQNSQCISAAVSSQLLPSLASTFSSR